MAVGVEKDIPIVNRVIPSTGDSPLPLIGTTNPNKLEEIAAGLGIPLDSLQGWSAEVPEIQDPDPITVVKAKAIAAYEASGGIPVLVEDTSLAIDRLTDVLTPTFVKSWASDRSSRRTVCRLLKGDRGATGEVRFAVYDGSEVHIRSGRTRGQIAKKPQGPDTFGWDDMFIPDDQDKLSTWKEDPTPRTFAQMTLKEKMELSMRQRALENLRKNPFALGIWVHGMTRSLQMELDAIDTEYFKDEKMAQARRHAFGLRSLAGMVPNDVLEIEAGNLAPIHELILHPDIRQYTIDPTSADIGVLTNGYDLRKLPNGAETRLRINPDGRPSFFQHTPESYRRALSSRAYEFSIHHNPETYMKLRAMLQGEKTPNRPNMRSQVIESLLGMKKGLNAATEGDIVDFDRDLEYTSVPGFTDLAYTRQYSEESQSRTAAAMNHILNRNGAPTSIFALGGMPPVTGSRDVLTTAALSFMRSYIPHNSLFVDFERRKQMFEECRTYIEEMIPDEENEDIQKLAIAQIGVCISGKDVEAIAQQTDELLGLGCGSMRIYTTNPGPEVIEAARAIGKTVKEKRLPKESLPFHVCVGPIVDAKQAEELLMISEEYGFALTLLGGHGGGENCTSLEGGAAANAIEIIYELSLRKEFNNVSLGFEGGLGTWFGPWLGIIEQISKDGSLVKGCVETQGGLAVAHRTGAPVQPYSGTASPWTQMLERVLFPHLAQRTNPAGQLKNNEGKPNYMKASHWAPSITNYFWAIRSMLGRTLADQKASSIAERIEQLRMNGYGHRAASPGAVYTAKSHRSL